MIPSLRLVLLSLSFPVGNLPTGGVVPPVGSSLPTGLPVLPVVAVELDFSTFVELSACRRWKQPPQSASSYRTDQQSPWAVPQSSHRSSTGSRSRMSRICSGAKSNPQSAQSTAPRRLMAPPPRCHADRAAGLARPAQGRRQGRRAPSSAIASPAAGGTLAAGIEALGPGPAGHRGGGGLSGGRGLRTLPTSAARV